MDIKASMPPFNNANKLEVPAAVVQINVPCFGPNIANAVMRIFQAEEFKAIARELGFGTPAYVLSKFVQDKMPKVHDLIKHARTLGLAPGPTDKLEAFVKEFQALSPADVRDTQAWQAFLLRHVSPGWEARLSFDKLLGNFGFDESTSDLLRQATFPQEDGGSVTFQQHSLRWLGKAFTGYGPEGALVDVVNLAFAMTGASYDGLSDVQIAEEVDRARRMIEGGRTSELWIPSRFMMDAESDDCLSWIWLVHIHRALGSKLDVLIQLPPDPEFDRIADHWTAKCGAEVWRDPNSMNAKAIKTFLRIK